MTGSVRWSRRWGGVRGRVARAGWRGDGHTLAATLNGPESRRIRARWRRVEVVGGRWSRPVLDQNTKPALTLKIVSASSSKIRNTPPRA